jgi:hypothetical protein
MARRRSQRAVGLRSARCTTLSTALRAARATASAPRPGAPPVVGWVRTAASRMCATAKRARRLLRPARARPSAKPTATWTAPPAPQATTPPPHPPPARRRVCRTCARAPMVCPPCTRGSGAHSAKCTTPWTAQPALLVTTPVQSQRQACKHANRTAVAAPRGPPRSLTAAASRFVRYIPRKTAPPVQPVTAAASWSRMVFRRGGQPASSSLARARTERPRWQRAMAAAGLRCAKPTPTSTALPATLGTISARRPASGHKRVRRTGAPAWTAQLRCSRGAGAHSVGRTVPSTAPRASVATR